MCCELQTLMQRFPCHVTMQRVQYSMTFVNSNAIVQAPLGSGWHILLKGEPLYVQGMLGFRHLLLASCGPCSWSMLLKRGQPCLRTNFQGASSGRHSLRQQDHLSCPIIAHHHHGFSRGAHSDESADISEVQQTPKRAAQGSWASVAKDGERRAAPAGAAAAA